MRRIAATPLLALPLMLAGQPTRAAEPAEVISLSCDGTKDFVGTLGEPTGAPVSPINKMGLILNFTEHTVAGLRDWFGFDVPAHIDLVNNTRVEFSSDDRIIKGAIDRVTGHTWAMITVATKTAVVGGDKYDLICKVTNRLF